jgi:hypothetical protein
MKLNGLHGPDKVTRFTALSDKNLLLLSSPPGRGRGWVYGSSAFEKKKGGLTTNLDWFGVPPSGGSNGLDRPKTGLQAGSGFMVPIHGITIVQLSTNLLGFQNNSMLQL